MNLQVDSKVSHMFFNVLLLGTMRNVIIRPVWSTYPMRITLYYPATAGTRGIQGDYYFSLRIVLGHIRFRSTELICSRNLRLFIYFIFALISDILN